MTAEQPSRFKRGVHVVALIALGYGGGVFADQALNHGNLTSYVQGVAGGSAKSAESGNDLLPDVPKSSASTGSTKKDAKPAPVIVIDPGHSGTSKTVFDKIKAGDKTYKLKDFDYPNDPEIYEVFDVGSCVAKALKADGYKTIMTKQKVSDTVTLKQRADIANKAHADLAISIHDDHSVGSSFQAVYSQKGVKQGGKWVDMYRKAQDGTPITFNNPTAADNSQDYAENIAKAREKAQGHTVKFDVAHLDNRTALAGGNMWMVQLFSDSPWVYNEMGTLTGGNVKTRASDKSLAAYAVGLTNGIEASLPYDNGEDPQGAKVAKDCVMNG